MTLFNLIIRRIRASFLVPLVLFLSSHQAFAAKDYWIHNDTQTFFFVSGQPSGNVGIGTVSPIGLLDVKRVMMVLSNGNVGIGSTAPASILDVAGTAQLRGSAGGTGLYVNAGGNVGIGTTGPATMLHVFGTVPALRMQVTGNGGYGQIEGNGNNDMVFKVGAGSEAMRILSGGNVGIGSTSPRGTLDLGPTGKIYGDGSQLTGLTSSQWTTSSSNIYYNTGNVGIGTTAPLLALQVIGAIPSVPATSGTTQAGGIARLRGGDGNNAVLDIGSSGSSGLWLQGTHNGDLAINYPILLNPNGGNIGIGTATSNFALEVKGANNLTIQAIFKSTVATADGYFGGIQLGNNSGNQNAQFVFNSSGTNVLDIRTNYANVANKITLSPGASTVMTILGSGNVGIGTTLPVSPLVVSYHSANSSVTSPIIQMENPGGSQSGFTFTFSGVLKSQIRADSDGSMVYASKGTQFFGYYDDFFTNVDVQFGSFATPRMVIKAAGNVGIGTTSPVAKLHVGTGNKSGIADLSSNSALIKGNLEVDGLIYGNGANLTNLPAGAAAGATTQVQYNNAGLMSGATGFVYDTAGNVGIGSTLPQAKLVVAGNTNSTSVSTDTINDSSNSPRVQISSTEFAINLQ